VQQHYEMFKKYTKVPLRKRYCLSPRFPVAKNPAFLYIHSKEGFIQLVAMLATGRIYFRIGRRSFYSASDFRGMHREEVIEIP
jgi:hypothetical protein